MNRVHLLRPRDWDEALAIRAMHPEARPIAGGTDVMVGLRTARLRPPALLDLSGIHGFRDWRVEPEHVHVRAGVTYTELGDHLGAHLPGVAMVASQVGSRQVRNRGTIGGALGVASPSGDLHPMLLAVGADIEVSSVRGTRRLPADRFYLGPGVTALGTDELISGVRVPRTAGPQHLLRIGRRQGMVKTICSVAVALDVRREWVGVGAGGVGPVPHNAATAGDLLASELSLANLWHSGVPIPDGLLDRFGRAVAAGIEPETDLRATAAYRRHATAVLAGRCVRAAWATRDAGSPDGN